MINGKSHDAQGNEATSPYGVNQRHLNLKHLYNSADVMFVDELSDSATDVKSRSPLGSLNTIDVIMGNTGMDLAPHATEATSLSMASPTDDVDGVGGPQQENNT